MIIVYATMAVMLSLAVSVALYAKKQYDQQDPKNRS